MLCSFENHYQSRSRGRSPLSLFVIPLLDPVPPAINTMYSIDYETTKAESNSASGKSGVEIQKHIKMCFRYTTITFEFQCSYYSIHATSKTFLNYSMII